MIVNNRDTKIISEITPKPTITLSRVFFVNFQQISHVVLVFPLIALNK